jgi:hypothetical protein
VIAYRTCARHAHRARRRKQDERHLFANDGLHALNELLADAVLLEGSIHREIGQ